MGYEATCNSNNGVSLRGAKILETFFLLDIVMEQRVSTPNIRESVSNQGLKGECNDDMMD